MQTSRLEKQVKTGKYLYHVTSEETASIIMSTGILKALTKDGTRERVLKKQGMEEKGTASFTTNPLEMLENDVCFLDYGKTTLMVFDKEILTSRGVKEAIYVPEEEILTTYINDYMYAAEEAEHENEWRSVTDVDVSGALVELVKLTI